MSIQSEMNRIQENVSNTYEVLASAGAPMPQTRNSDNLPATAAGIQAVLFLSQTLTEAQKAQARQNIGAQSVLTETDKEDLVQQVITALGTPVFGRVDEANNIVLTGELADGTYMLKYEDAEGNQTEIGTIEVGGTTDESGPIAIEWAFGVKLDKNTGAEGSGDSYGASQQIPYDSAYTYTLTVGNDYQANCAACWYGSGGTYLGWNEITASGDTPGKEVSNTLAPLSGAVSFRLRGWTVGANVMETALGRVLLRKDLIQ